MAQAMNLTRAVVGVVCAFASAAAQERPPAVDVSGKWALSIMTSTGLETRSLDLRMDKNGNVGGMLGSPYGDVALSSGRMTGDRLSVEFLIGGGQIRVTYTGAIRNDTLRGTWRQDQTQFPLFGVRGTTPVLMPKEMTTPARRDTTTG